MNKELSTNSTLSHYRIVSKIGAGGMGEVYLAQDTKLDRRVALKILPADLAANQDRMRRFVLEAKAAAALNHPNIAHVYEIGESEGTHFIAMEFIDGVTLREKIYRDGASLPKLLKYLTQVAKGLAKAHAAGIVHRDLKPDNIMITRDDYAKVLDFGLAKLVELQKSFGSNQSSSSEIATAMMPQPGGAQSIAGMVMGTIGYMSPEQASGRVDEIDHRSDIFSFGCILFEAATGQKAFAGKDALDSLHMIVHAPTPQLKDVNPLAPDDLQRVVRRCLAKEADKRYQSMKEVAIEIDDLQQELKSHAGLEYTSQLKSSASPATSGATTSDEGFWVAVLPFKYRGSNVDLEALAEGLSEDIVTGLSRFSYLRIIARGSTLRYTSEAADIRTVGKEIGARYIMEGSLRVAGSVLRVSVQLVDSTSGSHIWAETYNRTFTPEQLFALQDDLVPRIVSTVADMHGVLPRSMSEVVRLKSADQMSPYEALLYSFGYNERFTPEALAEARACLERAVERAPGNADCWAMLSLMYSNEYGHWHIHKPDSAEKALRAARTAVQAAPLHSLPYYALAQALFFRKEIPAFRVAAERAVSLSPMDGATAAFMGLLIAYSGEWERGCALASRGLQLNPNQPGWYLYTAWHDAYRRKDYRTALDLALKLNAPDNFYTHAVLAMCYAQMGQIEAARKAVRDLLALKPDYPQIARQLHAKWIQPDLVEELMDGLRKAGLEIANEEGLTSAAPAGSPSTEIRADEGFWVALLPFKYSGSNVDLTALSEGLSDDIVTGLSRFSYLRVIARGSTLRYANQTTDLRTVGKELGARYIMEGTLRLAGSLLRAGVQLVDATTGAHLWAETYDRPFRSEDIFALQDDLVPRIVSTVADQHGVLPHTMSKVLRTRDPETLSPYEVVLRGFGYYEHVTAAEHASLRAALERAVEQAPSSADCWAMLSIMYCDEHKFGFNPLPDSLGRAHAAAQRAVEAAASNPFAYEALAQALFFRREFDAFRNAAERAIALNPLDGATTAFMGLLMACTGDWEHGCAVAERATQLNPHHPGWYCLAAFWNAYRKGDYRGALSVTLKFNMPGFFYHHVNLAIVYGQLGEREAASKALQEVLALKPDFAVDARDEVRKWLDPELAAQVIDGLRKAGLEIADEEGLAAPLSASSPSSEIRSDEGFWVAVLPFKAMGSSSELETLASGMTEEIITGLSRFSYLRVIARSSTLKYSNESGEVLAIGNELGARYVMEGSIRQAGSTVRLTVQLVDATTGAHLWAETYDRQFQPDQIFAMQDELIPRVVSTCADHFGVLARSISDAVRWKDPGQLSPYEALMRGFGYHHRLTPSEHAEAREVLERAVEQAPGNADCWAMLSWVYSHEYGHSFNTQPGSLDRALAAAQRAVDLAPSNHLAYQTLAVALFFRKDTAGCLSAAERAMALNPLDASNEAIFLITFTGDWERGSALIRRAMELNPYHPGWYGWVLAVNEYRKANYRTAVDTTVKANVPGIFWTSMLLAAAYGQLGELEAARDALRSLLGQKEDYAESARQELGKWFDSELVEHLIEGLRKAGLEVDASTTNSAGLRADEGFWVAVLPFKASGTNLEITTLAEGLSEEIVTGLSRFSYLRVIARSSTSRYASETVDVRSVGKEVGARYVIEGSLRQSGSTLRVAVQLIDASTGANLWAETYNRTFNPEAVFELQDDLVPRIVSTVADMHGVLARSMSEAVRNRTAEQLTPYEAVLRSFGYMQRVTPEELAAGRSGLELAVQKAPGYVDAWAMLALLCVQDYAQSFNLQADSADSLASGLTAARRAVELEPSNHLAHFSLAQALFFQKEFQSFRNAAERTVALNPMDSNSIAFVGELLTYTGDWERGLELAARAKQLNTNHPGWYWYADCYNAYRQGDDLAALGFARRVNLPDHWAMHAFIAAAAGQLGERDVASKAVRDLLKLQPEFLNLVRAGIEKWFNPDYRERVIEGWRKAGLEIPGEEVLTATSSAGSTSSGIRVDEGFWVAVLPFKSSGTSLDEVKTLAEGLSEEIVTGLSRFSYLRVITRSSPFGDTSAAEDIRIVGKDLGARYVMEGNVRQAGSVLRLGVQLVDASTGARLWAETYERTFSPDAVFELQDDLVPRIVSTVADMHGVLPRSMSEEVRNRTAEQLTPYEAVLRSFGFFERVSPGELAEARAALELAVRKAPTYADAWAMLALICVMDYAEGFNLQADSLTNGALAAQRAVEAGPSNNLAYSSLAQALFFQKEFLSFRNAAERAIALNPMDASMLAFLGVTLAYVGEWERGCALAERAMQLNPNHPGWYRYAAFFNAYRQGDYRGALDVAIKIMPRYFWSHAVVAAAAGQLGDLETARTALREILAEKPDFGRNAREEFLKWNDPELVEHVLDGLRKAGLEITDEPSSSTILRKTGSPPSIAVLPFVNISNDPNNDYFCDGLAEELLNALSKVADLKVAARTSAFSFKGKNANVSEIGQKLNVKTVLEGSVRKSGDRLRISVQLISVSDGFQLWSERYDRELRDVFDVQDEIALSVIDALRLKLFGDEKVAVLKRYTNDAEVHELFLKGRYHAHKYTAEGWQRAIEFFEQAIEKQPNYAPAYAGMAAARGCLWFFGLLPAEQTIPQCKTAAKKALEIDENLADAYLSLAIITFFYDWEWEKAELEFKRSISLNPNSAEALSYYAMFLGFEERFDEAISRGKRSLEIDPLSPLINMNVGWTYFSAGLFAEALDQAGKMIEIEPDFYGAYWLKGAICLSRGEYEEAVEELKKALTLGGHQIVLADLGSAYGLAGKQDKAVVVLDQLLEMRQRQYVPAICMARIYSRIGENNKAIEWLEKAFEERNGEMVFLEGEIAGAADGDSLNSLGSDPKLIDLLRKMNLP